MPETKRPTWDEYFLEVVHALRKRATCNRGRAACLFVKNNQILSTGYVGSPPGFPHCDEVGHLFHKVLEDDGQLHDHCMRTLHAEQNAICQAAKRGIALEGSTLYVTMFPCRTCAMLLISIGIKRVVAEYQYQSATESEQMLRQAGVQIDVLHNETHPYEEDNKKGP